MHIEVFAIGSGVLALITLVLMVMSRCDLASEQKDHDRPAKN